MHNQLRRNAIKSFYNQVLYIENQQKLKEEELKINSQDNFKIWCKNKKIKAKNSGDPTAKSFVSLNKNVSQKLVKKSTF